MFNSVRFRISLWYAAALAVTLSLFSWLVYDRLQAALSENTDQLLAYRAEGVADALEAYLETERIEVGRHSRAAAKQKAFYRIAPELVRFHADDPRQAAVDLRIMDASGKELIGSGNSELAPELPDRTLRDTLKGNAAYDTISLQGAEGQQPVSFRSYATPAAGSAGTAYVVQAYRPTYYTQFALRSLRYMMMLLVPLIVLLTSVFGMFFARVALRPVADMARTIRRITAANLGTRLAPPGTRDEIRELADLFNAMLSRLENAFLSERRFIQDASHELKTPLTILKGELEVALKKPRQAADYEAVLRSNLEETEKMSRIVGDLLTLARFDNREVKLEKEPLDLRELLEEAAGRLGAVADSGGVRIKVEGPGAAAEGDRGQVSRLLLNLLDNAVKYSPRGSEVRLKAFYEGGSPAVSVSDAGPGIAEADLPHIFKRFYRADSSRSSAGFGLGLPIAASIAEAHGASIKVKGGPGGAVFTVLFPRAAAKD